jgi:hypothetical protein
MDCAELPFMSVRYKHDQTVCAQDREAVIALYTRITSGESVPEFTVMPSGRTMQFTKKG